MAVINGTNFAIFRSSDSQIIGHSNSCNLTIQADLPESTNKDSNGFQEVICGLRSAQITIDGLTRYGDPLNYEELSDLVLLRTPVDIFIESNSGYTFRGDAFVTNASETANLEEAVNFSIEIEITNLYRVIDPDLGNVWAVNDYNTWQTTALDWDSA